MLSTSSETRCRPRPASSNACARTIWMASLPNPRPRCPGRSARRRLALESCRSISLSTISPRYSSVPRVMAQSWRPSRSATVAHQVSTCSRAKFADVPVRRLPSGSLTMSHMASASSARTGRRTTSSPLSTGVSMLASGLVGPGWSALVDPLDDQLTNAAGIGLAAGGLHHRTDDRAHRPEVAAAHLRGDVRLSREGLVDRSQQRTVVGHDAKAASGCDLLGRALPRQDAGEDLTGQLVVETPGVHQALQLADLLGSDRQGAEVDALGVGRPGQLALS